MCTVTVRLGEGDLLLTMSRDEQRVRDPEQPPKINEGPGVRWVAPIDGAQGGTWIFLRADCIAGALLNRYQDVYRPAAPRSRGLLMTDLASHADPMAYLREPVGGLHAEVYSPFTLLLFTPSDARRLEWNGAELTTHAIPHGWSAFSSSSWNTGEVLAWRAAAFEEWCGRGHPFAGELPDHHLLQPPGMSEWAPMMSREKTCTRSITQFAVVPSARSATMRYWSAEDAVAGRAPTQIELPFAETPT